MLTKTTRQWECVQPGTGNVNHPPVKAVNCHGTPEQHYAVVRAHAVEHAARPAMNVWENISEGTTERAVSVAKRLWGAHEQNPEYPRS